MVFDIVYVYAIVEGKTCWWICLSNYKIRTFEATQTRTYAAIHARVSSFVPIVTEAMIYRRATTCVEVSTERNERLLTTRRSNTVDLVEARRAALFSSGLEGDSFIEVSIGSYNNYLSRIRGGYPLPLLRGKRAPLSSTKLDSATNKGNRGLAGGIEGGRIAADSCSARSLAVLINYLFASRINICRLWWGGPGTSGDSWESRHRSYHVTNRQFLRNARDLYMGGT